MPDADDTPDEDPNKFPLVPGVAPLDEAPDGQTPADVTESSGDSLPPGAKRG